MISRPLALLRRSIAPLVIAGALLASGATDALGAVRVMTWNVAGSPTQPSRKAVTPPLPFRIDDITAVVGQANPDVLGLQEVCSWEAEALAAALGYSVWHQTTIAAFTDTRAGATNGRCDFGDALLSRSGLPTPGRFRHDLLAPAEGCKSDAAQGTGLPECRLEMAALPPAGDQPRVRVSNTHVGVAAATHATELSRVLDDASSFDSSAVMLGDFNTAPENSGLAAPMSARGYTDAGGAQPGQTCSSTPGCDLTFPAGGPFGTPSIKPDYIWVRGYVVTSHQVPEPLVDGREASDHRPIIADLVPAADAGPPVSLTAPAMDGWAGDPRPTLSGAGSAPPGASSVTVRLYAGSTSSGSALLETLTGPVAPDGTWSVRASASHVDGSYVAQAAQTAAGHTALSSINRFRIDTAAPAIAVTTPAAGDTLAAAPTYAGTAGTANGDDTTIGVQVFSGPAATGAPVDTRSASVDSAGHWSVGGAGLADGTYTVAATQADAAGNAAQSSPVTFTILSSPPSPPSPPPSPPVATPASNTPPPVITPAPPPAVLTPADRRPPRVLFRVVPTSIPTLLRRGLLLWISSSERGRVLAEVRLTRALSARLGLRGGVPIGRVRTQLAAHRRVRLTVALSSASRAALRRIAAARLTVTVVVVDAAGNSTRRSTHTTSRVRRAAATLAPRRA